jgi:hypothetical protein
MSIRIDDHLRRMPGAVLIAERERRYSYKRGIKCQPTLALLLLGD